MTQKLNYTQFVNKIIELLLNSTYDEYFNEQSNKIGREIYNITGYRGLYKVMNMVEEELLNCEYSNEILSSLRNLEVSWSGICEEWQM
jgi:hypothetical protein